jgi:spermidine synthase
MSFAVALIVAALSGFVALSYEILWYRVVAFASWGLPGAFGLLLGMYLAGIAVGSRIAGALCKDDVAYGDPKQLRKLAAFAFGANLFAWLVVPIFGWTAAKWNWPAGLVAVLIAAGLLGAILPLVSHFGIRPDDRAGMRLSYVYLTNIIGSAAGSLITGFVFMDMWSIQTIAAVIGVCGMVLVALLVVLADLDGTRRLAALGGTIAATVAVVVLTPKACDRLWERLLYRDHFRDDTKFAEVVETKSGVITVTKFGTVYGGGAYDGRFNTSIRHDANGIVRAYAVGALHPNPKKMLMIGLSSGSWATVLANMPGLEHLTIVEINPGYVQLIANHEEVAPLLKDPKVEIVIDDGRRWLHRHPDQKFDVVVQNTTWHWRAHITSLVSREYMQLVREHLEPGGLFHFNTTGSADIQKTAVTEWPYAMRVYNFMAVSTAPLTFEKPVWAKLLADYKIWGIPEIDRSTEDGQKFYDEIVAYADTLHQPPDSEGLEAKETILERVKGAKIVTDDNMVPEWEEVLRFPDPP